MKLFRILDKLFLTALFIAFQAGTSLFYHVHVFNGTLYFHSHPFHSAGTHSDSTPGHSHSKDEFAYYHHIGEQQIHDNTSDVLVLDVPDHFCVLLQPPFHTVLFCAPVDSCQLRGPPPIPVS